MWSESQDSQCQLKIDFRPPSFIWPPVVHEVDWPTHIFFHRGYPYSFNKERAQCKRWKFMIIFQFLINFTTFFRCIHIYISFYAVCTRGLYVGRVQIILYLPIPYITCHILTLQGFELHLKSFLCYHMSIFQKLISFLTYTQ